MAQTREPGPSPRPDRRLEELLLEREREIGELLLSAGELEYEIVTWLAPRLGPRRREIEELKRKPAGAAPSLEAPRAASGEDPPGRKPAADVAVVLCCRHQGRGVEKALADVLAQTRPPSEVVLVGDGSADLVTRHVLARLAAGGHRVLAAPEPNAAAARNLGVRSTRAPWVVLADGDAVFEPGFLEETAALCERRPELAFVACEASGDLGRDAPGGEAALDLEGVLDGAGLRRASFVRRQVWEALGGHDEDLGRYAETDFLARAVERGLPGASLAGLVAFPLRSDAVDHGAADPGAHVDAMRRLYEKHAEGLARRGGEALRARERFLDRQRRRVRRLTEEKARIEGEFDFIAAEVRTLRAKRRRPIDWGELERTAPFSHFWGLDRGLPVDRVYVEAFLDRHRADVAGRVLEIRDAGYTAVFGGGRVVRSDVLDIDPGNPEATIVADLSRADEVADGTFDCFLLTQTLNMIYDFRGALWHSCRILKPGGVLLCTVSALNRVTYGPAGRDGDHWRFTEASLRRIFAELVPLDAFEITPYGNVLACAAFLYGIAAEEVDGDELAETDPYFPLIYGVRVVKPPGWQAR